MIDLDVYFLKKFKEFFLKYFLLIKIYGIVLLKYVMKLIQLIHNLLLYGLSKTAQKVHNYKLN